MAITSETDICNLALAHLGEAPVVSLNEESAASRACQLHYEHCRDKLLRAHRWNFATARATLTALAEAPDFTWAKQYPMPDDCLRVLEVNDSEAGDMVSESWIIEGRSILADATVMEIVYIKRVTDVSEYDSLFVDALSYALAIALSESIRGTTGKTRELFEAYERIIAPLARRVDANEGRRRKGLLPLNSLALRARGGWPIDPMFPYTPPVYTP